MLSREVSSLPLGSKVVTTSQPVISSSWMLHYRIIMISPAPPLRGRRTDGGTLECIDLFSCSHKGDEEQPGWPICEPAAIQREWRWKIVTRELQVSVVVMVLPLVNVFLGPPCERDRIKYQHSFGIPRIKWASPVACRLEKERNKGFSSIFSMCEQTCARACFKGFWIFGGFLFDWGIDCVVKWGEAFSWL